MFQGLTEGLVGSTLTALHQAVLEELMPWHLFAFHWISFCIFSPVEIFSSVDSVHLLLDLFPNISWHVLPFAHFPLVFSKQLSLLFRVTLTLVCIYPPQPEQFIVRCFILVCG